MKEKFSSEDQMRARMPRRDFVRAATAATVYLALDRHTNAAVDKEKNPKPDLSPAVQMQFMRPGQLEKALRDFPVAYVPFGPVEWHGRHLPLGTDALKAHGILVKTA
ncbi:creatininase family protein, partial [Planctomycetota bacterium]